MMNLSVLSVTRRLALLIASAVLGVMVLTAVFLWSERTLILQERQAAVQQTVEVAHGVLAHFQTLATQGKMTQEAAQLTAMETVRNMRYGNNDYFWVNDMQARMIMHPMNPALQGQDVSNLKDTNGQSIFNTFVQTVKDKQAGFVSYPWPKPGATQPVLKISYVKGFAPWGLIIGSGVYVDTVDAAVWRRALGLT